MLFVITNPEHLRHLRFFKQHQDMIKSETDTKHLLAVLIQLLTHAETAI